MVIKNSTWPSKRAVAISDAPHASMMFRQLFAPKGWRVEFVTTSPVEAIRLIKNRQAFMIIVDDSREFPAAVCLRQLLTEPIVLFTPLLCFLLSQHMFEQALLTKFAVLTLIDKPVTQARFEAAFLGFIKTWEKRQFVIARVASAKILVKSESVDEKIAILQKLEPLPEIRSLVISAIALFYMYDNRFKDAESVLLSYLRSNSKDPLAILLLGHLYMHASMPNLAFRLFNSIYQNFKTARFILIDMAQAKIFLDEHHEALEYLEKVLNVNYYSQVVELAACKINMALNQPEKAKANLKERPGLFKKLILQWEEVRSLQMAEYIPKTDQNKIDSEILQAG